MMIRRMATVVGLAGSLMMGTQATAQNTLPPDALPAPERPEVIDIGPPILISRRVLALALQACANAPVPSFADRPDTDAGFGVFRM